ncbi:nuclear transport factor 2 family protein [Leptolyngbya sp. FACHB-671]|uniref:nuclear transport factor 2 family protein n=1 Tax=Leptolyngbya sp. FACHB-671 TaxID=2692812 RepID=UPI001682711E|nr:nuclear transport factor 2 family protein [Leptolyngbya sp. FACHB-671]
MKTNLEIIREFYETLNFELVAPDVDWKVSDSFPADSHYQGRKRVQEWAAELAVQFHDWKNVPEQLLDTGDAIIALGHYQGRSKVTGKPCNVPFSHIWFMKDGRIIKLNHHINTLMPHRAIAPNEVLKN